MLPYQVSPIKIGCKALKVTCLIGVNPEERITPQTLLIDCSATLQLDFAHFEDAIQSTVSYTLLAQVITQTLKEGQFKLLETAAYMTLKNLLELDARLLEVSIHIEKQAIAEARVACVSLTMRQA